MWSETCDRSQPIRAGEPPCFAVSAPDVCGSLQVRRSKRHGELTEETLEGKQVEATFLDWLGQFCCHTFRATGITAYLENGGTIEKAQQIATHESPKTTKLYDRTSDQITLDEVEQIII
jgi:integrase